MKIIALKSRSNRVPIVPSDAEILIRSKKSKNSKNEVFVESGIGNESLNEDEDYLAKGCVVFSTINELKYMVQSASRSTSKNAKEKVYVLCVYLDDLIMQKLSSISSKFDCFDFSIIACNEKNDFRNLNIVSDAVSNIAFYLENLPRISRAQSMDVLSSQNSIAGYLSVIEGARLSPKIFPMLSTAAGTIKPARVLVIGAGVAGLQAIATAKRLGAIVFACDVREESQAEVESLGAKFVKIPISQAENTCVNNAGMNDSVNAVANANVNAGVLSKNASSDSNKSESESVSKSILSTSGGYVTHISNEAIIKQQRMLREHIVNADLIVCMALVRNRKAPILVTRDMVSEMKSGSVIVDLAASSGGNCELTSEIYANIDKPVLDGKLVVNGVTICGYNSIVELSPYEASNMLSKNYFNFVKYLSEVDLSVKNEMIENEMHCEKDVSEGLCDGSAKNESDNTLGDILDNDLGNYLGDASEDALSYGDFLKEYLKQCVQRYKQDELLGPTMKINDE